MNAVIIERDAAAGRALRSPAIPDLTLPQFVLGAAGGRGSKRALVDAATGRELSYSELADAVRETGAGLSARGMCPGELPASAIAMRYRAVVRKPSPLPTSWRRPRGAGCRGRGARSAP